MTQISDAALAAMQTLRESDIRLTRERLVTVAELMRDMAYRDMDTLSWRHAAKFHKAYALIEKILSEIEQD